MKMAEKLALHYGADVKKARLVGLSHDIAKEYSKDEILDYITKNKIELDKIEINNLALVHGKIGAHLCKNLYNFDDEMCDAIFYHTTGKENMCLLTKILFIADLIEENRTFSDVEYARKLAFENLDEAIIYVLNSQIKKCVDKGVILHTNTVNARNYLLM